VVTGDRFAATSGGREITEETEETETEETEGTETEGTETEKTEGTETEKTEVTGQDQHGGTKTRRFIGFWPPRQGSWPLREVEPERTGTMGNGSDWTTRLFATAAVAGRFRDPRFAR
jgi:hypothetical protein